MGNFCCGKRKKTICLLLLGLDNAGKTVAVKNLAGESIEEVVPTIGFSVTNLTYKGYNVKVFDLGGGVNIRGIWHRYFVDAHGIIFVIDSSDFSRLLEVKEVLNNLLSHEKISGKPVLILANKQDDENALDEIDLIEGLQLEELVNREKCPTLIESCSATSLSSNKQLDPGIKKGYNWLLNFIIREYKYLNERVVNDEKEEEIAIAKKREEIIQRIKYEKEREKENDNDIIELFSEYTNKINGYAHNPTNSINSKTLSPDSSRSSPRIYNGTDKPIIERPKSATQIVKEQLELGHISKSAPLKIRQNKTQPIYLYSPKMPRSAKEHRTLIYGERRNLRSAGDSIFIVSEAKSAISYDAGSGDFNRKKVFDTRRNFVPAERKNVAGGSKSDNNAISIVEVD